MFSFDNALSNQNVSIRRQYSLSSNFSQNSQFVQILVNCPSKASRIYSLATPDPNPNRCSTCLAFISVISLRHSLCTANGHPHSSDNAMHLNITRLG